MCKKYTRETVVSWWTLQWFNKVKNYFFLNKSWLTVGPYVWWEYYCNFFEHSFKEG